MQKNILEYLEYTANRLPEKTAFSTGKESMTFSEVLTDAKAVGSFLLEKGFSHEPVVIFMDKHPRTVTAFFGVIYAGCYYVCLDEKMPKARMEAILENLKPRGLICDQKNERAARELPVERVFLYARSATPNAIPTPSTWCSPRAPRESPRAWWLVTAR